MMSTPTQPHVTSAHQKDNTPESGLPETHRETPSKAPQTAAPAPDAGARESAEKVESYTIRPGDTLLAIAARRYGNAREWRRITKANYGLYPRRLRGGPVIALPGAISSQ